VPVAQLAYSFFHSPKIVENSENLKGKAAVCPAMKKSKRN
jgi:hypothetical protein